MSLAKPKITSQNRLETVQFDLEITFNQMSARKQDAYIASNIFTPPGKCEPKFHLAFQINTKCNTTNLVLRIEKSKKEISVQSSASVLNLQNVKQLTQTVSGYLTECFGWNSLTIFGTNVENILFDDKVRFYCEFIFSWNCNINSAMSFIDSCENPTEMDQLVTSLQSLYDGMKLSDVILVFSNQKELKAHKNILAMRSPVFAAMFEHDTKEKQENRVEIPDVDPEIFDELLKYIYTGKLPPLDGYASELLVVSDKYQLSSLKAVCEEFLCCQLEPKVIPNLISLADLNNAPKLKEFSMDYLRKNTQEILESMLDGSNNSNLVTKAFRDFAFTLSNKDSSTKD